jgi:hypothetical protein
MSRRVFKVISTPPISKIKKIFFISMKQVHSLILLFALSALIYSCEEIGPPINLNSGGGNTGGDTTNPRVVLLEVFTAVKCVNCPQGQDIIDQLLDSFPGRIEVVEIHSGDLAKPINATDPDFRSQDADDLTNYLGPFPFQPSAAIDRKSWEVGPGDFQRLVDRNFWSAFVKQQLDSSSNVKLTFDRDYNTATRELSVTLKADFLKDINDIVNATILITESGIVAAQDDGPTTVIQDYVHDDVLRDILTGYNGELITGDKKEGSSWSITRTLTLPQEWIEDSCRIVGIVAKSTGTYDVLQSVGLPVH